MTGFPVVLASAVSNADVCYLKVVRELIHATVQMAKSKQQKELTLADLTGQLESAKSVVFADFRGLTVKEATEFRNKARKEDIRVLVAKKTLMRLAFSKAGYEGVDPAKLEGALVMITGMSDEVAPAKLAAEFSKEHEALKIVAGVLERKLVDAAAIKALAKLPSKQELMAKLVGTLNAPISGFVNVLAGNLRGLVNVMNAIKDQKASA